MTCVCARTQVREFVQREVEPLDKEVEQIQIMMKECKVMKSLDISCLGLNKKACSMIIDTIMQCANDVWGLDFNLR